MSSRRTVSELKLPNLTHDELRNLLVGVTLEWEKRFSVAPGITSAVAEYDAAKLKETSLEIGKGREASDTAVTKGVDFRKGNLRYQMKSNRPSGKPGSPVTLVGKASNYNWDQLIWILYDRVYHLKEAWEFSGDDYRRRFDHKKRLSPDDMRSGRRLK
ncbi:hypothetical protein E6H12_09160 [Candidatus Bathyarchaeota archaeon]|nr:MAG: hypothetical protein E6H12_09160 [Candidatus Bathyarchaeota archaeon]